MTRESTTRSAHGFSLLEVMIAVCVLAVGLIGGMGVICVATASNGNSRLNTTAATLGESTMERILALPQNGAINVTDCQGNTFPMNTALGGSPTTSGSFLGIDFKQAPVAGYSMQYSMCTTGSVLAYDVRWNIAAGPTPSTQLITVGVKSVPGPGSPGAALARTFTLHSLRGN